MSWKQKLSYQSTDHLIESSRVECLWRNFCNLVVTIEKHKPIKQYSHLSWLLARHGSPHINCGSPCTESWAGDVGWKWGPGEYNPGLGLWASMRRCWGSSRSCSGCIRTCSCSWGVGCAVTRRGGLWWDWLSSGSSSGSTSSYSSSILSDLLHKIPHEVWWEGTYKRITDFTPNKSKWKWRLYKGYIKVYLVLLLPDIYLVVQVFDVQLLRDLYLGLYIQRWNRVSDL